MEKESKEYNLSISLNNFSLSYDDVGVGSIPIIFLHGFPFDRTMWTQQVDFLKSSFRVITFDIRGFGKSKDEKSSLSIDVFGDDLINFMDKLGLDKAIVCGLSMGGFIALNALRKYPKRFEALILCDTQCIADTTEVKEKRSVSIAGIKANGVNDFNEAFIKSVFHSDSFTNNMELVSQLRSVVFSNSQHIISEGLQALGNRSETCSSLSRVIIPTLIICGREDEVTPLVQSEFMNRKINGSVLRVIDNAGHVSNLEKPHEFNKHLLSFLTSLKANGGENYSVKQSLIK